MADINAERLGAALTRAETLRLRLRDFAEAAPPVIIALKAGTYDVYGPPASTLRNAIRLFEEELNAMKADIAEARRPDYV